MNSVAKMNWQFPKISNEVEAAILVRQESMCAACGTDLTEKICQMHFVVPPHVIRDDIPNKEWGTSADNLIALCEKCFAEHRGGRTDIIAYFKNNAGEIVDQASALALGNARYRLLEKVASHPGLNIGDVITIYGDTVKSGEKAGWRIFVFQGVEKV